MCSCFKIHNTSNNSHHAPEVDKCCMQIKVVTIYKTISSSAPLNSFLQNMKI